MVTEYEIYTCHSWICKHTDVVFVLTALLLQRSKHRKQDQQWLHVNHSETVYDKQPRGLMVSWTDQLSRGCDCPVLPGWCTLSRQHKTTKGQIPGPKLESASFSNIFIGYKTFCVCGCVCTCSRPAGNQSYYLPHQSVTVVQRKMSMHSSPFRMKWHQITGCVLHFTWQPDGSVGREAWEYEITERPFFHDKTNQSVASSLWPDNNGLKTTYCDSVNIQ